MEAKIKLLTETAKVPTRGSDKAAGFDIYADIKEDIMILPGQCEKIKTGIAMTPPAGYFEAIFPRSGMAVNRGLRLANCTAVIDEDYTGEILVPLYNDSDEPQLIHTGDRIAQMVFLPYLAVDFNIVNELTETERGSGGFGSTGSR